MVPFTDAVRSYRERLQLNLFSLEQAMYDPIRELAESMLTPGMRAGNTVGASRPEAPDGIPQKTLLLIYILSSIGRNVNPREQPAMRHARAGSRDSIEASISTAGSSNMSILTAESTEVSVFKGVPDLVVCDRQPGNRPRASIVMEAKTSDDRTPWTGGADPSSFQADRAAQVLSYSYYMASANQSDCAVIAYWCPRRVCLLLLTKDNVNPTAWTSFRVRCILTFDLRIDAAVARLSDIVQALCNANGRRDDVMESFRTAGADLFSSSILTVGGRAR